MNRTILVLFGMGAAPVPLLADGKRLPSLPDKEGFAGAFAGTSNGALVVAGGANFPGKKPWEGGAKVWHDNVFVLEKPGGEWKRVGKLPRALGYGVSVTYRDRVVCAGGSDAEQHFADCFALEWSGGKLTTTKLPPLPKRVANACGALVGDTLYVAGGTEKPDSTEALRTVFTLDLSAAKSEWHEEKPTPAPGRVLAVGAAFGGKFWLVGGAELLPDKDGKPIRRYLKGATFHDPTKGWGRGPELPRAVVAAPSPAPADAAGFYLLGGDDGSQLAAAPTRHTGFSKKVLRFDGKTGAWVEVGELTAPRVTAPCVRWRDAWVVSSGEVRPGVRSPEVWRFKFPKE
ncbi:MAG TPA: hypothetical protein VGE74_05295 [Gemmata sp.]